MRLGQLEICTCGYLGALRRVLVWRDLKPGQLDLYRRKLGLILIFDRERVLDVLAVRLTRVAGQCSLPLITPPSVLVNSAAAVKHAHKPKLVFLSGYPVNRWPHKTNRIDVI